MRLALVAVALVGVAGSVRASAFTVTLAGGIGSTTGASKDFTYDTGDSPTVAWNRYTGFGRAAAL